MLDKKVLPNGVYSANVSICGLPAKYKTFFPADWSRKKVVEAIFEAYENFLNGSREHNFTKTGNYRVVAMTSENMEIEMIIQKRGNIIKTAYPFLER